MENLDHITWPCHVCGEVRPDSKISVAKHMAIDGNGVEVGHNVRYCNDKPSCEVVARRRNHTQAALMKWMTRAQVAEQSAAHWKARFYLCFGTSVGVLVVGIGGVALANQVNLI